eukprot:11487483-Alexandrium_andersonii.AAC.1
MVMRENGAVPSSSANIGLRWSAMVSALRRQKAISGKQSVLREGARQGEPACSRRPFVETECAAERRVVAGLDANFDLAALAGCGVVGVFVAAPGLRDDGHVADGSHRVSRCVAQEAWPAVALPIWEAESTAVLRPVSFVEDQSTARP